jgi:hypothetical protein
MNNNPNLPNEPLEAEFPYYFEILLDVFQNEFPQLTESERLQKWRDFRIQQKADYSFNRLEHDTTEPDELTDELLVLTTNQRNLVKTIHQLYNHWKKILYPNNLAGGLIRQKQYYPFL